MKYCFNYILKISSLTIAIIVISSCSSGSSTSNSSQVTFAYITDNGGSIWQYMQESNNGNLTYIGTIPHPNIVESWSPDGMTFNNNYAYIADNNGALWVYKNNHGILTYLESIASPNNISWIPQNVAFNNSYAYITDDNGNIWMYNIEESGNLIYSQQQVTPARANWGPSWISFNGQYAYISDVESSGSNSFLWQYSISDNGLLANPRQIIAPNNESSWILWGGIQFNNNFGYVADNNGHVWQYTILNEESLIYMNQTALPTTLSNYSDWSPNNIGFNDGYAYITDYYHAMVWCYKIENNGTLDYVESIPKPDNGNFVSPSAITFYNANF